MPFLYPLDAYARHQNARSTLDCWVLADIAVVTTEQMSLWEEENIPAPSEGIPHGPQVVHCKLAPVGSFVYIGRPSLFGNPHLVDSERECSEAPWKYEEWLLVRLEKDTSLQRAFENLRGHDLGWWCKTKRAPHRACHGDIPFKWLYGFRPIQGGLRVDSTIPMDEVILSGLCPKFRHFRGLLIVVNTFTFPGVTTFLQCSIMNLALKPQEFPEFDLLFDCRIEPERVATKHSQ